MPRGNPCQLPGSTGSLGDLALRYAHLFRLDRFRYRRGKNDRPLNPHVFYMALDAEWVQPSAASTRNQILSYQIATIHAEFDGDVATHGYGENILRHVTGDTRYSLPELVEAGLRSIKKYPNDAAGLPLIIILVAHHFVAEWTALRDRDEKDVLSPLSALRKTLITMQTPITTTLGSGQRAIVSVFDTRLIAPQTHQSLARLSTLLGREDELKETISQRDLERMDLFRQRDMEGFERYALKDTEVTLKVYLKIQDVLNRVAVGESPDSRADYRLFPTLGSASVHAFLDVFNANLADDEKIEGDTRRQLPRPLPPPYGKKNVST